MKNKLPLCLLAAILLFSFNSAKAYDLIVAKDGSGNYTTVQAAINAAPTGLTAPYYIYIENGTYTEVITIPSNKPFIYLIGQSVAKTILTYNNGASTSNGSGGTLGTSGSGSFNINATDFTAQNITFQNTFGDGSQAVAVIINADRAAFKNCRFMANQDTLYTKGTSARAYFKNCYIDGNIDFIFGSSIALFDSCTIYAKTRTTAGSSYMTAANTPAGQAFGYVFNNCNYPANTGGTQYYLGRPWQNETGSVPLANNQVVYLNAKFKVGQIIPAGWVIWDAGTDTTLIYDAEYQSENLDGSLADVSQRVTWSHQLNSLQAANYTMANMFVGSGTQTPWNPCSITPTFCADSSRDIAVSNFRGSKSNGTTTLNWNISWGMAGIEYDLYRSSNDTTFTQINSVTETADTLVNFQLTDAAPPAGSVYYYYIVASKAGSPSHFTDTVSISSAPTITVTGTLGSFVQGLGLPSTAQTYAIAGVNLVDNITITPPVNFEVSNDGGNTWFNNASPLVIAPTSGSVSDTISVRLNASALGNYSGTIVDTTTGTGANSVDLAVSGVTQAEVNISTPLQQWPLDVNANDSAAVRSAGVTASTPTFNNLYLSNGTTVAAVPAYSATYGQAYGPTSNGDGTWKAPTGPGGTLSRIFYEQFTVTANTNYTVRVDSLILNAGFYNTSSSPKFAVAYSVSGFISDSTDVAGASFAAPIAIGNSSSSGTVSNYRLALNGGTGITLEPGQTLSLRLYNAVGSSSAGRYGTLKNVFVTGDTVTGVVPVTLLSFTGSAANSSVQLKWHTANEMNTASYVVERSADDSHFTAIGSVSAANATYYSFTDNSPLTGSAYYRLKIVDKDGSYTQSNIVSINAANSNVFIVYPNPANDFISIQYPVLAGTGSAKLSNADGKTVQTVTLSQGSAQTSIDINNLADGLYFININVNGINKTLTFVKQ